MAWLPPRRITSTPTSIQVTGAATSALATAASTMVSGEFKSFVQDSYWQRTQDPREPTANENIAGANYRWTNPTEQGDSSHGLGYTMLDWGSKFAWDSQAKQAMFAGNGANPQGSTIRIYGWQFSKFCRYDAATDTWVQERGIKADTDPADPDCIVHLLSSNCIDVTGRRFFKKKFRNADILIRNLNVAIDGAGAWSKITPTVSEASGNRAAGLDFIPGRGTSGMLWGAYCAGNDLLTIYEINPSTGAGTTLVSAATLGNQNVGTKYGMPCVYNPRAFGGAGGVLVGYDHTYKLTIPPSGAPTVYDAGVPVTGMTAARGHRVCADPVGDGWYHFISGVYPTGKIYRTAGNAGTSSWTEVATLPPHLTNSANLLLCPIPDYGVIWCLTSYMYDSAVFPVTWTGGQNGCNTWLWKP